MNAITLNNSTETLENFYNYATFPKYKFFHSEVLEKLNTFFNLVSALENHRRLIRTQVFLMPYLTERSSLDMEIAQAVRQKIGQYLRLIFYFRTILKQY